ncbi:MFS transporter [Oleiharenicola lentus]|uniref:MFS transporter n=1 Tax=Oleiharenicola lentus TaxID=2508720 RepID=UPI003F664EE8
MLGAVMFCYLFYYTGRQTFGFAIPGIQQELGLSKQMLGWVSACMLWAYAAGQMINGNLGDKFGGRRMMMAGAVASFGFNWLTSFGTGFKSLLGAWGANGLAQSMGWAPGSRLVANWWGAHERGRAFGFFVLAAGLSSVLSYITSLVVLDVLHLEWRWIFRLPVALMLLGGFVVWFFARDKPEHLGFAALQDEKPAEAQTAPCAGETVWQRYRAALGNGRLILAGLAIGFQNAARYGLLVWVPVHFLGSTVSSGFFGKWISVGLPVGMALGAVTSGWISDRFCKARRSGVIVSFMALAALSAGAMFLLPKGHWFALPLLFLCGFFAYGPQSTFWALAPDLLGRARTGTAVGVMNCFAYLMAGLAEPLIGWTIQHNPFGATPGMENTALVFPLVACFATCSAAIASFIRR